MRVPPVRLSIVLDFFIPDGTRHHLVDVDFSDDAFYFAQSLRDRQEQG